MSSARFCSVLEDKNGNFWFGSVGSGAFHYDGKSFRIFTTKDGLFNDEIFCIYEDSKGNIWFGVNGGASCYDGVSFRNYAMNGDGVTEGKTGETFPSIRPPNYVNSIIEDKTGNLWFGRRRDNAFVYDGKRFTALTSNGKPMLNVGTIIEDNQGNIWLGGEGLWRFESNTFTNISLSDFLYVYADTKGNIWTSSKIISSDQIWVLSRYEAGALDKEKLIATEVKRQVRSIFCILEARDGSIWYASSDGVYRYDGKSSEEFKRLEK